MIRLTGILAGSILAVAILILLIGVPQIADPAPEPQVATEPEVEPEPEVEAEPEIEPAADLEQASVTTVAATTAEAPPPLLVTPEQHWYAFWSPFSSEIAANGFVAQLQRVTGFDYKVVRKKPGVYEVALAYWDDVEIPQMLQEISAATGLDIPER
jgi:hypothetical protein